LFLEIQPIFLNLLDILVPRMSNEVDIRENDILAEDKSLLEILLTDHSRPKKGRKPAHIIWATHNYESLGTAYADGVQMTVESITGENGNVIQPRVRKPKDEQLIRAREKGEVFTPSWICNKQNNLVDNAWFGRQNVFNIETEKGWITNLEAIEFPTQDGKTWEDYVRDTRLEITCGEAPYLISRYDAITGKAIPVKDRVGLLDRKLRVVTENTTNKEEWFDAAKVAYKHIYGYEWQGDNLLLARESAFYSFIDYYEEKFEDHPSKEMLREIAEIISWNLWQMDGLKGVIPNSCHDEVENAPVLFGEGCVKVTQCPGCKNKDFHTHNGIYCKIMDWEINKPITFISLLKK